MLGRKYTRWIYKSLISNARTLVPLRSVPDLLDLRKLDLGGGGEGIQVQANSLDTYLHKFDSLYT